MGILFKRPKKEGAKEKIGTKAIENEPPKLARRKMNRKSTIKLGRTIAESREKLETASERNAAHKKNKRKKIIRISLTTFGFILVAGVTTVLIISFVKNNQIQKEFEQTVFVPYSPTIEVIDEDKTGEKSQITSRMKEYIGQAEFDFRELGYTPSKVIIPSGSIREVDFYLDGYNGFIKLIIDRETAVSVEDADRVIRFLSEKGIDDFEYIDVRIEGRAYWK